MYAHVHMCMCTNVSACVHVCARMHVHVCMCVDVCMCVHIVHVRACMHVSLCMSICVGAEAAEGLPTETLSLTFQWILPLLCGPKQAWGWGRRPQKPRPHGGLPALPCANLMGTGAVQSHRPLSQEGCAWFNALLLPSLHS